MDKGLTVEEIHKEIDLLQASIQRMANNSFLLKGWMVSLIAVVIALAPKEENELIIAASMLFVIISFWFLDAFFLKLERIYRMRYDWVLKERPRGNREGLYCLNPNKFGKTSVSVCKIMWSRTLVWFYAVPFLAAAGLGVYFITV